jgi:hypothetical protein
MKMTAAIYVETMDEHHMAHLQPRATLPTGFRVPMTSNAQLKAM